MNIGILSRKASLYSTRRLKEAAIARGHHPVVVDYLRCYMDITARRPQVLYSGRPLRFDAVIPRIGTTYTFYGTAVVRQFEMMDVATANSSQAISRARDKLRSLQLLSRRGVDLPVTGFAHSPKDIEGLIDSVGGPPLIVKLLEGTQGIGVVLAETSSAARSVISAFRQLNADILVQQFIQEAKGADLRAFVVDKKVVAAMKRQAPDGEFRSNLHAGGSASKVRLTPTEVGYAVKAARALGLNVAGVDMLRSKNGPLVIEVNSSPGLEGIEAASGKDVAGAVIEFLEKLPARAKKREQDG